MKKKLICTLCAVLCILLGAGAGYLIGQAEYRSRIDRMYNQAAFPPEASPLIADAQAAAALAETYYRENVDPDGSDPRLTSSVYYSPQSGIWKVGLSKKRTCSQGARRLPRLYVGWRFI